MTKQIRRARSSTVDPHRHSVAGRHLDPGLESEAARTAVSGAAAAALIGGQRGGALQRRGLIARLGRALGNHRLQRLLDQREPEELAAEPAAPVAPAPAPALSMIGGHEVVRMRLRSPAPASSAPAPASPALDGGQKASAEGMATTLAPVQTEDEKINYTAATTPVLNDLTPSGSSGLTTIGMSDVAIGGAAYLDGTSWKIRVNSASTTVHWGITTSGYSIPNPVDGGNITAANWRTVVAELRGYEARQASGSWHHPDASRTHELNHVSWFQGEITRTWPAIETAILAHVLGASPAMDQAAADAAMATFLNQKRRDWFNAYGVAPEPPAYAAGQAVLNGIITQIESYAASKGWS